MSAACYIALTRTDMVEPQAGPGCKGSLTFAFTSHSSPLMLSRSLAPLHLPLASLCRAMTSVWLAATQPWWTAVMTRATFILESLCWPAREGRARDSRGYIQPLFSSGRGIADLRRGRSTGLASLTIIVDEGTSEALALEQGELLHRLAATHEVRTLHVL